MPQRPPQTSTHNRAARSPTGSDSVHTDGPLPARPVWREVLIWGATGTRRGRRRPGHSTLAPLATHGWETTHVGDLPHARVPELRHRGKRRGGPRGIGHPQRTLRRPPGLRDTHPGFMILTATAALQPRVCNETPWGLTPPTCTSNRTPPPTFTSGCSSVTAGCHPSVPRT
jgi:hypothetical protein